MKVLLTLFLCFFICSINSQLFDYSRSIAPDISLDNATPRFGQLTDQIVVGSRCEERYHEVTSMVSAGPQNSGTYFFVEMNNLNNTDLTFRLLVNNGQFGDVIDVGFLGSSIDTTELTGNAVQGAFSDEVNCNNGICGAFYYCDIYPDPSDNDVNYFIGVFSPDDNNLTEENFYDISFTQFVVPITVIPQSGVTTQGLISDPFDANNVDPENFVQYYYDLDMTIQQRANENELYITLDQFLEGTPGADGEAIVCVSYDGMVGSDIDLKNSVFDNDDDGTDFASNGCQITCASGQINNGVGTVRLTLQACGNLPSCTREVPMWIGVRPPSNGETTGYRVSIDFNPIPLPPIALVTADTGRFDDVVESDDDDNCNFEEGVFNCENYYELSLGSVSAAGNDQVGPFLYIDVFGVRDGNVEVELTDGYLGGDSNCGCGVAASCQTDDDDDRECTLTVPPCAWNEGFDNEWVVSVAGRDQDYDDEDAIERYIRYGMDIDLVTYDASTITENGEVQGRVRVGRYDFYKVTIPAVNRDSVFEVEVFPNFGHDNVGVYYSKSGYPGAPQDCLDFDGFCLTSSDFEFKTPYEDLDTLLVSGQCRFSFYDCDYKVSWAQYESFLPSYNGNYVYDYAYYNTAFEWGLKIDSLEAVDYYFAVQGYPEPFQPVQPYESWVDYTFITRFYESLEVTNTVTYLETVHPFEYSRQFFFDIPNDARIVATGVRIDDVQSGALQAYIRCNDFAGDCPCYSHDSTCTVTSQDIDANYLGYLNSYYSNYFGSLVTNFVGHDCDLTLSHCDCSSGDRVYVSVRGLANSVQIDYYNQFYGIFDDDNQRSGNSPIGFSMTANIFIQSIDEDDIEPIVVGSEAEPSLDTDILYFGQVDFLYDSAEYDFYTLDFSEYFDEQGQSTLGPDDTLEIMLVYNGLLQEEQVGYFGGEDNGDDDDDYYQDFRTQHPVAKLYVAWDNLAGDTSTPLFCDNVAACTVRSGEYPVPSDNGYSYCSLVFEGCGFDSSPECFDTRDLRQFDDDSLTVSEYEYGIRYQMENDDDTGFVKDSTAVFNSDTILNRQWYVTVQNLGFGYNDFISNSYYEGIQYTLRTRVVTRSAVALSDGIAFYGEITDNSYRHYSFNPSGTNNNNVNWLWAELWDNADQLNSLAFYMNYWEDATSPVKAGSTDDCFYHIFPCDVCTTRESSHYCRYEIEPCDYNTLTGTYYFSVKSVDHIFFNEPAQYNIRVSVNEVVDISNGIPLTGTLYEDQTFYYMFNINNAPASTNQNALERYFSIEIDEVILGDVFVNVQQTSPNDECFCRDNSVVIQGLYEYQDDEDDDNTSLNFVRFDCNGVDGTYYINVGANHFSDTLDTPYDYYINANPVSYIIHSQVWDVLGTNLPLTTNSSSVINQSFDSNTDIVDGGFQVRRNEIHVYSFNVNNPNQLSGLNVELSLNTTFSPVYPLDIYITQGSDYFTPSGFNDDDNHSFGDDVDSSSCVAPVGQCTISNGNPDCRFFFDSCDLSTSTQFHITVIGETIPLHSISNEFDISIGVVDSNPIVNVPVDSNDFNIATTNSIAVDSTDIVDNFGNTIYFSTVGTTGLQAGEHFEFTASGFGNINFQVTNNIGGTNGFCSSVCSDSGSNPSCKVYSCNTLSASTWFFAISGFSSNNNGQITIQRFANPCPTCTTTSTSISNDGLVNGPFTVLANDEWAYYSTNVPAADNSEFELLINGGGLDINDLVFVDQATILPGISQGNYNFNTLKDTVLGGSSSSSCASEFSLASYEAECCYDSFQNTFAVLGNTVNADYDFTVDITPLTQSGISISLNNGAQNSGSVTINNQEVQMITVSYDASQNLFVQFTATSNSSEIYMSHGSTAGSNNNNDKGSCYPNDNIFHNSSPCSSGVSATGTDVCEAFIPPCGCFVNAAGSNTHTVTFAIIPNEDFYTGDYFFATTTVSNEITQNSQSFSFPETSISDRSTRTGNTDYSAINIYSFPGVSSFLNLNDNTNSEFFPFILSNANPIDRPSIRFRMTNIQNQTLPSSGQPFNIETNNGRPSTNNQCGGGDASLCIENSGQGTFNSDFTEWNCTINLCDLSCDLPINIGLTRNSLNENRWTFNLAYEFVNFDVELADPLDSVIDLDVSGFNIVQQFPFTDVQNRRVIYRLNAPSFPDVTNLDYLNQWMTFTFSDLQTTSNAAVDVSFFTSYIPDGSTCYDFNNNQNQATCSFDADDDCFFEIDPCLNHNLWRNPSTDLYIVVEHPSTPNPLNYTMTLSYETVTDVGGSPTTIDNFDSSYSATKEINNGDWHFYQFNLPNPDGYHGMRLSISDVVCENNGNSDFFSDDEGVFFFTLFDDDDKNFVAPSIWPTFNCATDALSVHETGSTSVSTPACYYTGGIYRVGVFANYDAQQFNNVPIVYTIELTFETVLDDDDNIIQMAPEQEYSQSSLEEQYFEFRFDYGYNRGTEVEFYVNINSDFDGLTLGDDDIGLNGDLLTLYISKNASPFNDDDGGCEWDTDRVTDDDDHDGTNPFTSTLGDYACTVEDSDDDYNCVISIPACEFENTIFYGYLESGSFIDGSGIITIGSRVDNKYIPVYDMVSSTTGVQITNGVISDQLYQYYRIDVDSSLPDYLLSLTLYSRACEADNFALNYLLEYYGEYDDVNVGTVPACSFDMFVSTGIFGFSAGSRYNTVDDDDFYANFDDDGQYGPQCTDNDGNDCPCFQKHCSFDDVDQQCTIYQSSCSTERDTMFVGITTYGLTEDDDDFSNDDNAYLYLDDDVSDFTKSNQCSYELEITSSVSIDTVAFDNKYCDTVSCMNYYTPDTSNIDTSNAIYEIYVNNYGDADLTFYISEGQVPFVDLQNDDDCFEHSFSCAQQDQCSFKLSCTQQAPIVLVTRDDGCFDDCFVTEFSIEFVLNNPFDYYTIQTITPNNPVSILSNRETLQYTHSGSSDFVYVVTDAFYGYTVDNLFDLDFLDDDFDFSSDDLSYDDDEASCRIRLCDEGFLFDSQNDHTYYFYPLGGLGDTFELQTLTNIPTLPASLSFIPRSSESQFSVFQINPALGVQSVTISFSDVTFSDSISSVDNLGITYSIDASVPAVSDCACNALTPLTSGTCQNTFADINIDINDMCSDTLYLTIGTCGSFTCDVSFDINVEFQTTENVQTVTTTNHNGAFSNFITFKENCALENPTFAFTLPEDSILNIQTRNLIGETDFAYQVTQVCNEGSSDPSDDDTDYYNSIYTYSYDQALDYFEHYEGNYQTSLSSRVVDNSRFYCASAGTYYLDFSFFQDPTNDNLYDARSFDYKIVTEYVPLSGSSSNTITGHETHFYSFPNTGSFKLGLTIEDGTSLKMIVHDGCSQGSWAFSETKVCSHGTCYIDMPTRAKASNADTYYVIIESGSLSTGPNLRNANDRGEYPTSYSLNLSTGASLCTSLNSGSGFCSDVFSEFSINSARVMSNDFDLKHSEAEWRYNKFIDRCPTPTQICKDWLKRLSCLESFPSCDANSYQNPTCVDACHEVEFYCGAFIAQESLSGNLLFSPNQPSDYARDNIPRYEYTCNSDRYASGSDTSCIFVPPTSSPTPSASITPSVTATNTPTPAFISTDDDDTLNIEIYVVNGNDNNAREEENNDGEIRDLENELDQNLLVSSTSSVDSSASSITFSLLALFLSLFLFSFF